MVVAAVLLALALRAWRALPRRAVDPELAAGSTTR
jgi:hypothetical protein